MDPRLGKLPRKLTQSKLDDLDLVGADLRGRVFHGVSLRGRNLEGALLAGVVMQDVDLSGACLAGATLEGADLDQIRLEGADMRGASLVLSRFNRTDFSDCRLEGSDLTRCELGHVELSGADFTSAILEHVFIFKVNGTGTIFREIRGAGLRVEGGSMSGADFSGSDLVGAVFESLDFGRSLFLDASMARATFHTVDLKGAVLTRADLRQAQMTRVVLDNVGIEDIRAAGLRVKGVRRVDAAIRKELEAAGAQVGTRLELMLERFFGSRIAGLSAEDSAASVAEEAPLPAVEESGFEWTPPPVPMDPPPAPVQPEESPLPLPAVEESGLEWTPPPVPMDPPAAPVQPEESLEPESELQFEELDEDTTDELEIEAPGRPSLFHRLLERFSRPERDLSDVVAGAILAGVDLRGADLSGRDLAGVDLSGARLDKVDFTEACLDGACLDRAFLRRARFNRASLVGATAKGSHMEDSSLRAADLEDFDASESRMIGVDFRDAHFRGTRFLGTDLSAARLVDVDLADTDLTDSILEQTDLAGARMEGVQILRADIDASLGLDAATLRSLRERGARLSVISLARFTGNMELSRLAGLAAVVMVMTLGGYLALRFVSLDNLTDAELEGRAIQDAERGDMVEALERYEALVERAKTPQDRVLYTFEIALLMAEAGQVDGALEQLGGALAIADTQDLQAEVQIRIAEVLGSAERLEEEVGAWEALTSRRDLSPDHMARSLVGMSDASTRLGFPDRALAIQQEVLERYPDNPGVLLAVNRSMAELLAARGEYAEALEALERVEGFPLDEERRVELLVGKARLFEAQGDGTRALEIYIELRRRYPEFPDVDGKVLLSMAGLAFRQGGLGSAWDMLTQLRAQDVPPEVHARALVLQGQVASAYGEHRMARKFYLSILTEHPGDRDAVETARLALARTMRVDDGEEGDQVLRDLVDRGGEEMAAQALLGQAQELASRGDLQAARELHRRVIAEYPGSSAAETTRTQLAELLVREGKYPEAVRAYRKLLSEAAGADQKLVLEAAIADALLQGGRLVDAELAFESILDTHGSHPEASALALLGLARVSESRGDHERCRSLYERVSKEAQDPALRSEGLEGLAESFLDAGRDDEAMQAYRRFVDELPWGHEAGFAARMAMAGIFLRRSETERARLEYEALAEEAVMPSRKLEIQLALAELAEQGGRLEEALDAYLQLMEVEDLEEQTRWQLVLGIARVHLSLGNLESTVALAERWEDRIDDATGRVLLNQLRVKALRGLGRNDEAVALSETLLQTAGDDEEAALMARLDLAHEQLNRGEFDAAIRAYRALEKTISDRSTKASMMLSVGRAQVAAAEANEARSTYRSVISSYSDLAEAVFEAKMGLSDADRLDGNITGAIERYKAMSGPDVGSEVWRREQLAQVWSQAGNQEESRRIYEDILRDYPGNVAATATARNGLAGVLRASGDLETARGLYRQVAVHSADLTQRAWAELNAAGILSEQGQMDKAFFALRKVERESADPEVKLQARLNMASIFLEKGRPEQALDLLDNTDVVDLGVGWVASVTQVRVASLLAKEDLEEAQEEWKNLLETYGGQEEVAAQARLGMAEVARKRGEYDRAVSLSDEAFGGTSDRFYQAQALLGKALALRRSGKEDQARRVYDMLLADYSDQPELLDAAREARGGI